MNSNKKDLILDLFKIGAVKFGSFKLKSGLTSPFYIDLRTIISYPKIVNTIVHLLKDLTQNLNFDLVTGIPYTALPIASIFSSEFDKPLIYQRKEAKAYGTSKSIEGAYGKNDTCLVIDDVMTTGESKIETAEALNKAGIKIKDFVIIVDRSFNGSEFMAQNGYTLNSILTIKEIVTTLYAENLINLKEKNAVEKFIKTGEQQKDITRLSDIKKKTKNKNTQRLIENIIHKKSNLVISLDVDNQSDFFNILEVVSDQIVMVKTHVDIVNDFSADFVSRLLEMSKQKNFLIFEDRKFADIGSTVRKQFNAGIYKISEWADFVTVHSLPGEGIIKGLFENNKAKCSAFLLSAMSAKGNLINDNYSRATIEMGERNNQWISGFIGFAKTKDELQKLKTKIPNDMLLLMPGVNMESKGDKLGQQYVSVEQAVSGGADLIIVGRGIIASDNPAQTAENYRKEAWQTLVENKRI